MLGTTEDKENMGNFKQRDRSGGRRNSRGFSGQGSGKPDMYKTVCDDCGKDCQVPFRPTGDKPVFCSDCFRGKDNAGPRRSGRRDSGRFDSSDKKMHDAVCDKCGKKCEVPFRPTGDKPVYCSQCFTSKGDRDKSPSQANKQLEIINTKLDKILEALTPSTSTKVEKKKKVVKKVKETKPKKVSKTKDKKAVSPKKAKPKKKTLSKK